MLMPISNAPREYDWGSTSLLADLQGRPASGRPEAEIWFGDHPGSPSRVAGGASLDVWLAAEGAAMGSPARLPYLLKLLAAGSSLSIQAHPSRAEAIEAFAREEAAGIPRDAPDRIYRDPNHKPELIVALSDTFTVLVGIRALSETRRLLALLGAHGLAARLDGADAAASVRATIAWLLSGDADAEIAAIAAAAASVDDAQFADELALLRRLATDFPGDPGIGVALLMNHVTLRRGEGLFVPAGVLHAYQEGLGVEIMAASDNVLRGGLTPKHVAVTELVRVMDATPGPAPVLRPAAVDGIARFAPDIPDFALARVTVTDGRPRAIPTGGDTAIVLATRGAVTARGAGDGAGVALQPGDAVLVTPDEPTLTLTGAGEVFIARPGAAEGTPPAGGSPARQT